MLDYCMELHLTLLYHVIRTSRVYGVSHLISCVCMHTCVYTVHMCICVFVDLDLQKDFFVCMLIFVDLYLEKVC